MSNTLTQLSEELAGVVDSAGKSVVAIYAGGRMPSSGVHWKPGLIVTTEHSLRRDEEIKIGLPDGTLATAELAGRDPGSDLAVLKFDGASLPTARPGAEPRTGEIVLAVGRHRDIGVCAAMGIVSVVGPGWNTWRGGRVDTFIRLDLELYTGSSGAVVVNTRGEAIGVATSVLSRIAPVAIPTATVERVSSELSTRGRVRRGYIGVGMQPVPLPENLGSHGLIVLSVEPDSPASRAGLVVGDILVQLGGRSIKDTRDVQTFLMGDNIGKPVTVSVIRGGQHAVISLTVGEK